MLFLFYSFVNMLERGAKGLQSGAKGLQSGAGITKWGSAVVVVVVAEKYFSL